MVHQPSITQGNLQQCPACGGAGSESDSVHVNGFDIIRCCDCGLRFVPADQISQNVNYDDLYKDSGDYSHHVGEINSLKAGNLPRFARARRIALERIQQTRPGTLLEIGCGVGNFLAWIQHFGIRGFGVDASANAIELARQHLKFPLHCGLFQDGVFDQTNFDAICTWEVLEHIHDVKTFISKIHGRLNPGGCLMLSTPNYGSAWVWRDVPADPRSRPPVHLTFWDESSLSAHLKRCGFSRVEIRPLSVPLNPAQRSGPPMGRPLAVIDSLVRPSQRQTLLAMAWKPNA